MSDPDVLIVGGGIGGLALALSLHQAGISARVFEAAPDVLPLGVGINLLPHATKELAALGLEPALASHVNLTYCTAGHMLYTKPTCLDSLHSAMTDFYRTAAGPVQH